MRCYIILLTLSLLTLTQAEEFYSDKYDYIDVDEILQNDRQREQYYKCFMDMGPCMTADAIFIKEHIVEAFITKCQKCTEKQKQAFNKVSEWFAENEPDKWEAFMKKMLNDAKNMQKNKK